MARAFDQMSRLGNQMQQGVKRSSSSLGLFSLRLVTGLILGLVFAIAGDAFFQYSDFMFYFFVVLTTGIVLRVTRRMAWPGVIILDVFCVLVALLLRFYVVVAPGA